MKQSDASGADQPATRWLLLLILPAVALNVVSFLWPMFNLTTLSFRDSLPGGAIGTDLTTQTWFDLATDRFTYTLLFNTLGVSLGITAITLLASYPVALFIHRAQPRWRNTLMIVCISPLLISAVVRTYGLLVILRDNGLFPALLRAVGVSPPRMMFNMTGVVIGMVEILMPYMILSLLAGFGHLNAVLEDAAASLGARPWTVFRRIVLPLSAPGILLGCLLTFVLAVSSFITPKLLGGGRVILLATEIYDDAVVTLNWPVAAALSVVALVVFGLAVTAYSWLARRVERSIV